MVKRRPRIAVTVLLLVAGLAWYAVALGSMWNKSAGIDEIPHFGAGLSALHYGDFRMNPEHPPLAKILGVLPVYLFAPPDLRTDLGDNKVVAAWADSMQVEWGYYLLFLGGRDPLLLLRLARVVPALWGLLGGLFAYLWGRELSGRRSGGALAAAMLLMYPEYAGHARLLTLDVPTLACCAAVAWFGWKWWRRPTWKRAGIFVVVCAIGSQVKLPITTFVVFLLLTMVILAVVARTRGRSESPRPRRTPRLVRVVRLALVVAAAGIFAAWAGAGFRFSYVPAGVKPDKRPGHLPPAEHSGLCDKVVNFAWEHRLLPETALAVVNHAGSFQGRDMWLFQTRSTTGWYYYFLLTAAMKTPVAMIGGVLAAAVAGTTGLVRGGGRRRRWRIEKAVFLGLPFAILFLTYVVQRPNIGHRQVLFAYFPLAVLLGTQMARWGRRHFARYASLAILAGQAIAFAVAFPHYETYFNEFFRNPYVGSRVLYDSNVDWGTDLPLAGKAVAELGATKVNFAAFGFNKPEAFGVKDYHWLLPSYPWTMYTPLATPPDPQLPSIISVNTLFACRALYPALYAREPDFLMNSIVVYLPGK